MVRPPAPSSAWGGGTLRCHGRGKEDAKTCSRRIRPLTTLCQSCPPPASPPCVIARLAIEHAPQSQSAVHATKTPARCFVLDHKADVTARPVAHPLLKIRVETGWALALARRCRVSCRPFPAALPIAPALLAASLLAACAGPILPAGLRPPPAPRRLPAHFTAITRLWMIRPEQAFTTLEQTPPLPRAVWPLPDVSKTMTVVHGR